MTLTDPEWLLHASRAISAVAELLIVTLRCFGYHAAFRFVVVNSVRHLLLNFLCCATNSILLYVKSIYEAGTYPKTTIQFVHSRL